MKTGSITQIFCWVFWSRWVLLRRGLLGKVKEEKREACKTRFPKVEKGRKKLAKTKCSKQQFSLWYIQAYTWFLFYTVNHHYCEVSFSVLQNLHALCSGNKTCLSKIKHGFVYVYLMSRIYKVTHNNKLSASCYLSCTSQP